MHVTLFPESLIGLAVFVTVPLVLWRVSRRSARWLRWPLRGLALSMLALIAWNILLVLRDVSRIL